MKCLHWPGREPQARPGENSATEPPMVENEHVLIFFEIGLELASDKLGYVGIRIRIRHIFVTVRVM